jgi:hypothetical protein
MNRQYQLQKNEMNGIFEAFQTLFLEIFIHSPISRVKFGFSLKFDFFGV